MQPPAFSTVEAPTIARFMQSDAFIRGLMGPLGGGKSSGNVWDLIQRGVRQRPGPDGVRRTKWVVIRNTSKQLEDSTIRTFLQWFPPYTHGTWTPSKGNYVVRSMKAGAGEPCAEIEFQFRALDRPDQVGNLLSTEYTGGWINEAREVPWAVVEALTGRVGRFPAAPQGGATWSGITLDTNPPDTDSSWYRFFEELDHTESIALLNRALAKRGLPVLRGPEDYAAIFKQPSGISPQAENIKHLPPGYYERLMIGKGDDWIKVYVHGQYGFTVDGKPVFPEYSDTLHCPDDERFWPKTVPHEPVYRSFDFGLCYSDDTEVLTRDGWKFFKDVDVESDEIATRNPASGALEYARAAFKVAEPFKGELLEWASTEINMLVTPEHRVPYRHRDHLEEVRWASAEWLAANLGRHHLVDLMSRWDAPAFDPSARWWGCDAATWAEFLGAYLSEGTSNGKTIFIAQNKRDPGMQAALDATGWDWRRVEHTETINGGWRLYHPLLAQHLKDFGTQDIRRVPREIKEMPAEILEKFIWMYTLGDGHFRVRYTGAAEHTIYTISRDMAGDLQEIAQKIGWNSSMRWVKPQVSFIKEGATVRRIENKGGWSISFKKRAERAELHRKNFRRVSYDGVVYCLNVPHHTLYVRRNGRPHWNGNTPACVFSQITPDGRWIVVDELVSRDMGFDEFSDVVLEHSARHFPRTEFINVGDPAGMQRSQVNAQTCFQIAGAKNMPLQAAPQGIRIRLEGTRKPMRTIRAGRPQFLLHPRCKTLRKALLGGYHYRRVQVSGERYAAEPEKNSYSHVADALGYAGAWIFGPTLVDWQDEARGDAPPPLLSDPTRSRTTGY